MLFFISLFWVDRAAADCKYQQSILQPFSLSALGFFVDLDATHHALREGTNARPVGRDYWDRLAEVVEDDVQPLSTYVLLYAFAFGIVVARETSLTPETPPPADARRYLPLLAAGQRNVPRRKETIIALVNKGYRRLMGICNLFGWNDQLCIQFHKIKDNTTLEAKLNALHAAADAAENPELCLGMMLAVERCDPHHVFTYAESTTAAGLYHAATAAQVTAHLRDAARERLLCATP